MVSWMVPAEAGEHPAGPAWTLMARSPTGRTQLLWMGQLPPDPQEIPQLCWSQRLVPATAVILQRSGTGISASSDHLWPFDVHSARQMCEALDGPHLQIPPDVRQLDLRRYFLGHRHLLLQRQVMRTRPRCSRWTLISSYDDSGVVKLLQLRWGHQLLAIGHGRQLI